MASSSGSYSIAVPGTSNSFYLNWQLASQNPVANQWTLNWQVGVTLVSPTSYGSNAVKVHAASLAGQLLVNEGVWSSISGAGAHQLAAGAITVSGDDDDDGNFALGANLSVELFSGHTAAGSSAPWSLPRNQNNATPPSSATASRVSDGQTNLGWTNNSTGLAEYTYLKPYRSTDGGAYALLATLGVTTGYADTTCAPNRKYFYAINAVGVNGVEVGSAISNPIYTTPAAVTGLTAALNASAGIDLAWTDPCAYSEHDLLVETSNDAGATWSSVTTKTAGSTTHADAAPLAGTVLYRVTARTTAMSPQLSSTPTVSNSVAAQVAPNTPTPTVPSVWPVAETMTVTIGHQPGADHAAQTAYKYRWRLDGGAWTTSSKITSGAATFTLAASTGPLTANGHTLEIQTQTWGLATTGGSDSTGASPWSASATTVLSARPTLSSVTPAAAATITSGHLTATWAYAQTQSSAQAAWKVELYNAAGTTLLASKTGTTGTTGTVDSYQLVDGTTYTRKVSAQSAAGLWSTVSSATFSTDFPDPATVTVTPTFDDTLGCVYLDCVAAAGNGTTTADVVSISIARIIPGQRLDLVTDAALVDGALRVVDRTCTTTGDNVYVLTAKTAAPASATQAPVVYAVDEGKWMYLSKGPEDGWAQVVRAYANYRPTAQVGSDAATYAPASGGLPQGQFGAGQAIKLGAAVVVLAEGSTTAEIETLHLRPGVALWRDPAGRRAFVALDPVSLSPETDTWAPITLGGQVIGFDETAGTPTI